MVNQLLGCGFYIGFVDILFLGINSVIVLNIDLFTFFFETNILNLIQFLNLVNLMAGMISIFVLKLL